ncbi:MAG: beta galactosidase jelly roll domain-containing protein [Cytophagaceae bacterium]|nr:beta galactosidase jelly roll domain-containing protein [Cytophagaceae bacterium]
MKSRIGYLMMLCIMCAGFAGCNTKVEDVAAKQLLLADNWMIQQSDKVDGGGEALSSAGANVDGWYGAAIPSTVMGALTANGLYADLLVGTNYKKADRTPFDSSWWYRTTFELPELDGKHASLMFAGISYRANVWLNGKQIASKDDIYGTFCRHTFDISDIAKANNVLAVEVFRAQKGEPNIGFVDWNPRPLDENMGIFREVTVNITGNVEIKNTWVQSNLNTNTLQEAYLNITTSIINHTDSNVRGHLKGSIGDVEFKIPVTLTPKERKAVRITPDDVKGLHINNPRIWWCTGMGKPELYTLDLKFVCDGAVSSEEKVTFGIRSIDTYFTEDGHRGYLLNGKKVLIKGAGWTDDIFLRDTPESNERQIKYVKDMNLNTIRFENIWGTSQNIYELCDRYGILALVGWSCQWEWESYLGTPEDDFMSIRTPEDMQLLTRYLNDQVLWLRNHPAIIAWYGGSDKLLRPELEKMYMELLPKIDDRPYIGSAKMQTSEVTGSSGMKMYGPYEYVGPNYWYLDTRFGGGYGFNTETSPGAQLPIYESIVKMIPDDQLYPMGEAWNYHCTTSGTAMNNMDVMTKVMNEKYGKANNLADYLRKADLISYESTKSMFEAFRVNKPKSTGLIQWMLNSAWGSMYWQLYDWYGAPTQSYYAVKKANNPYQLIYNYKDNGIYIVNELLTDADNLRAIMKTYSIDSELLNIVDYNISSEANTSKKIFDVSNIDKNCFIALELYDVNGTQIAENFYALSAKQDTYDWDNTSWVTTPMTGYADFKALANMEKAALQLSTSVNNNIIKVEIKNNSSVIAFFTHLKLKDAKGEMVIPAYWSDNYVNILPSETRVIECLIDDTGIDMSQLRVEVES